MMIMGNPRLEPIKILVVREISSCVSVPQSKIRETEAMAICGEDNVEL